MKPPASFYKIILPYVIQDHKLMIPREFTKVHGDKLSTTAKLTVPGGLSWDIGLEKSGKKLWFRDGWKEFAEHHSIQCWFFILFKYEGNSKFNVLIFDLTASLIPKSVSDKGNGEGDDSVEILSSLGAESPVLSSPQKVSYECVAKKATGERCNPSFLQNMSTFAPEFSMRIKTRGSHFSSMERLRSGLDCFTRNKRRKLDDGEEIIISEDLTETFQGSKQRAYKIGNPERILLDKSEKKKDELQTTLKDEEVENVASKFVKSQRMTTFKPENASFTVVLQPYHIRYGPMHVPVLFIKRYLNISSDTNITLTIGGKRWKVLLVYSEGSHCLTRGWVTFVRENQLSVGNTCVFELTEAKNITLKVSISQGGESLVKKRPKFAPESSMRLKTHGSHFSSMETPRSGLSYFTRNKRRKLDDGEEITKFENLTESRQGKQIACERPGLERFIHVDPQRKKSDDRKNGQNFPEGTQETRRSAISKSYLRNPFEEIRFVDGKQPINEAVDLKPGNPSFTVILRPYHVKKSIFVAVSAQFIRKYLNLSSDATILLTFGGRQWKVVLINSHRSPFLSRGWAAFVSDNQLSVGDTCVFELVEFQKTITFQVSISRGGYKRKDLDKSRTEGTHRSGIFKSSLANPAEKAATEVEKQPILVKEQEVEVLNTEVMKSQHMATMPERSKAITEAMMLKPENPYFMVFLKPHNVSPKYLMNVPAAFIEKYLNISSTTTILIVGGRQWEVVLFHNKISRCLRRGWCTFVKENHLSKGDVCVFELIQVKNIIIFKVSIFRGGKGSARGVKDEFG